jgi:predicted ferric reductase
MKIHISAKFFLRFITVITVVLFLFSKQDPLNQLSDSPLLFLSQMLALMGAVLFSMSFFLATRTKLVEISCDGLDKAYDTHHWLGAISFTLILNHQLLLVARALSFKLDPSMYFYPSGSSYWQGIVGAYILLTLIFITLFLNLPYNIWKITHKFMGVALFFGILHVITITSDVSRSFPLRIWVVSFMLIGLISYIYKEFIYPYFINRYIYKVAGIEGRGSVLDIHLKPINKPMSHDPGQFAYISVKGNSLIPSEEHPFSIASSCFDPAVRIGVKRTGDFTNNLAKLRIGDKVVIQGPYGRFFDAMKGRSEAVLIGGGIGITPFLGIGCSNIRTINMDIFYCFRNSEEAAYDKDLLEVERNNTNIKYYPWSTQISGRLTARLVKDLMGDLGGKVFLLCGPSGMMRDVKKQLVDIGVKKTLIYMENFYF